MSDENIRKTRQALVSLAELARRTEAAEREILARAEKRTKEVAKILTTTAVNAPEYLALLEERNTLTRVMALSRLHLGIGA